MKVKPHYWHDHLGGWDFDMDGNQELDIPEEVIKAYEKAQQDYVNACDAVRDAVHQAKGQL